MGIVPVFFLSGAVNHKLPSHGLYPWKIKLKGQKLKYIAVLSWRNITGHVFESGNPYEAIGILPGFLSRLCLLFSYHPLSLKSTILHPATHILAGMPFPTMDGVVGHKTGSLQWSSKYPHCGCFLSWQVFPFPRQEPLLHFHQTVFSSHVNSLDKGCVLFL